MNAIERNSYTEAWRAFGSAVPRPRAILAMSAHWYINATAPAGEAKDLHLRRLGLQTWLRSRTRRPWRTPGAG
jgi:hypothetical protein